MNATTVLVRDINGNTLARCEIDVAIEEVARADVTSEGYLVVTVWPRELEFTDCEVCGEPLEEGEDFSDHGHVDVVQRDGFRGQYLTPTFVLDVETLVPGTFSQEILYAADLWLTGMGNLAVERLDELTTEAVQFEVTAAEQALADRGYAVVWDDGYVIYALEGICENCLGVGADHGDAQCAEVFADRAEQAKLDAQLGK